MPTTASCRSTDAKDRRCARRFPLNTDGELYLCPPEGESEPLRVLVKDVSTTGLGVVFNQSLEIGQVYVVKESTVAQRDSVLFTVVRSDRMEDGQFSIGLQSEQSAEASSCSCASPSGVKRVATVLALALAIGALAAAILK